MNALPDRVSIATASGALTLPFTGSEGSTQPLPDANRMPLACEIEAPS